MISATTDFSIRPILFEDEGFIYQAWLAAIAENDPVVWNSPDVDWRKYLHRLVRAIIEAHNTLTLVAHVIDEPSKLLGFACSTPPQTLHWLYVKQAFRTLGIGSALLRAALPDVQSGECTFWSRHLRKTRASRWRFNPDKLKELLR